MSKLTILVDLDDVIDNCLEPWVNVLNREHGLNVKAEDITEWDLLESFPTLSHEEIYAPIKKFSFWLTEVSVRKDAIKYLNKLIKLGHEVYIVTASDLSMIHLKYLALIQPNFPIKEDHIIVTHRKDLIRGDILIDDCLGHVMDFKGQAILMTAPHNKHVFIDDMGLKRADNWQEVYKYITEEWGMEGV